jgi:6-phosphogluconolactonase
MFEGIGALAVDNTTGALSVVPGSPFAADQAPFFVRVHPAGQFLYTENIDATGSGGITLQSLSTFSIDSSTGALTPAPGSPFTPPASATIAVLAFHPSGKFLYAATGFAGNGVMGWSVDSTTGGLIVLAGSPYQAGMLAFGTATFDPSGKFLYVSAGAPAGILGFSVDASSGALTPLSGSPFSSTSVLTSPVVDLGGRFLFTSDTKNKAIVGFSLDSSTGALAPLGSPTPSGSLPITLTIVNAP